MKDTFEAKGKKFLAVSAHPDDFDFLAAGTVLKWLKQGATGGIVIVTSGDKGTDDRSLTSEDLGKIRHQEQEEASAALGLEKTWFLDYPDAHLEITQELKNKLVRIIREFKPDIVLTFDPTTVYSLAINWLNHPDHRAVGQATLDAVFPMARDFLTFSEHSEAGLSPHNVTDLFLYNFDSPNYFSDISSFLEEKLKIISYHKSQFDLDKAEKIIKKWNSSVGEKVNTKYAESFVYIHLDQ